MRPIFAVVALLCVASTARASDIALHWDDCGAAGTSLKTFACNTNTGAATLVMSFVPPEGIVDFQAAVSTMWVIFPYGSAVPAWWTLNPCRPISAITGSANFLAGPFTCANPWTGNVGGGVNFNPTYYSPTFGRLAAVFAIPPEDAHPLDSNTEYYAGRVVITYARTVGTGACAGCEMPVGFYLRQILLDQYAGTDYTVTQTFETQTDHRYYVGWQCEGGPVFDHGSIYDWPFTNCSVAARRPTWGSIKSLYR